MSTGDRYSDEKLHMFIDDEMNSSDRARMMEAINKDEQLSNRVCELMQLKDAVRLAYNELPESGQSTSHSDTAFLTGNWLNAAAAVLLLAIGTLGGWTLYPQFGASNGSINMAAAGQTQQENIILHISKSDPEQFTAALDYAEKFLTEHEAQGHQVDVVAHAGGLDMMRADASPIKEQIVAMMDKYDNVHFVACAGAIKMYTKKNGVAPDIIQGVGTDYTAFDHIVGRLQGGGWKYIKVESLSET
jgi:intracellular sulfur oxidation DsrE/DsrF family protein